MKRAEMLFECTWKRGQVFGTLSPERRQSTVSQHLQRGHEEHSRKIWTLRLEQSPRWPSAFPWKMKISSPSKWSLQKMHWGERPCENEKFTSFLICSRSQKGKQAAQREIFCGGSQSDASLISICFSSGVAAAHLPPTTTNFHHGLSSLAWWARVNIKQISLNGLLLCIAFSHLNSCPENFASASFILSSAWFSQNKLRLRDA